MHDELMRKRYARQLEIIGEEGQERLAEARVLVAGIGGLGSTAALYLAEAGIGTIIIADHDVVERSNLNRQVLHWEHDIDRKKVDSAAEKLRAVNPELQVVSHDVTINSSNLPDIISGADIIVDGMDQFSVRYMLNEIAITKHIPLIHGAVQEFYGQITTIIPGRTACLRCIFPEPPPDDQVQVLGTTAGIIGIIQANEVIKFLTETGELLENRLLMWDGKAGTLQTIPLEADPECPICSGRKIHSGKRK